MNNNIEVIGIDHGWSQMKTSNTCFNTSIKELANAYHLRGIFCVAYRCRSCL